MNEDATFLQVQMSADLKRRVKVKCASKGITAKVLITRLLEDYLKQNK